MHACYAYPNSLSLNGQVQEHSKHVACVFRVIYSFLHAVSHQAEALATLSMHHVLFPALLCRPFALCRRDCSAGAQPDVYGHMWPLRMSCMLLPSQLA